MCYTSCQDEYLCQFFISFAGFSAGARLSIRFSRFLKVLDRCSSCLIGVLRARMSTVLHQEFV